MAPVIEKIQEIPTLTLGEGPHWDVETQSLYLVDILGKAVYKYVPSTGQTTKVNFEYETSAVIPVQGKKDQFLVNQEKQIVIATWDGVSEQPSKIEKLVDIEPSNPNKTNDAKCDANGRLWTGTIGAPPANSKEFSSPVGSFFSLEKGRLKNHLKQIGISNGLTWNDQLKKFYYVDSPSGGVDAFDFDIASGTIANRTRIFTLKTHGIKGLPDGLTIDVDGNLWLAVFNSDSVLKIDPRKPETLIDTLKFTTKQVTSVGCGGPNLDILYVTSGNLADIASFGGEPAPDDGATFKVTGLGTKGLPAVNYAL